MFATDQLAHALLGPVAVELIEAIAEPTLKQRIIRASEICAEALSVVDALDLSRHETTDEAERDLSLWIELAPDVRSLLVAAGKAADQLKRLFPAEVEMPHSDDLEVALAAIEAGCAPDPMRDRRERDIDAIVDQSTHASAIDLGIYQLASMLQSDFAAFGWRLKNPAVVTDRWLLLGELQELKGKCTQCLEAVIAAMVQPLTDRALHVILPRYASATSRAVLLRQALVDLTYDIGALNAEIKRASGSGPERLRMVIDRLNRFADHPAYRYLRPADKRALSKLRVQLSPVEPVAFDFGAFRKTVDGLYVFLQSLRAINQRDLLVQHDLQNLQTVAMLLDAEAEDDILLAALRTIFGRNGALDDLIRDIEATAAIDRRAVRLRVEHAAEALKPPQAPGARRVVADNR